MLAAAALLLSAAVASAGPGPGLQEPAADPGSSIRLLDVPYLSQSEDLCGGAALAMVFRYWGARDVNAEDFAALVDRSAAGIRTDVLAAEAARRAWQSFALHADDAGASIFEHVDRGRPIIALIQIRPGRYHYVVIVARTYDKVILHDPARGPFQVLSRLEFDRAWAGAGRWGLLVLPHEGSLESPATTVERSSIEISTLDSTCATLVQQMVTLAHAGNAADAAAGLLAATRLCPLEPAGWRELAGVRFLQSRWADASASAEHAAALDPDDEQGWDLLATSRYLNGEPAVALGAWNRIGRPAIDLLRVEGARRTPDPVILGLVGLHARMLLSAEAQARATRRLAALPSAALTSLRYRPADDGLANVEIVVVERTTIPRGALALAVAAADAWLQREIRIDAAAPARSGELWTVGWRWWKNRPRAWFALAVPSPSWLPGVTRIEGSWERSAYSVQEPDRARSISKQERRRASVSVADWATSRFHWEGSAALDRWDEHSYVSVKAAVDHRFGNDHVAVGVETEAWAPVGTGTQFVRGGLTSDWRSTREANRQGWIASAGLAGASMRASFDLWPGAGTGFARIPLLRAHPLLDDGVIAGPAFGRRLVHGTLEYHYPVWALPLTTIRLALFADTARAWQRINAQAGPVWQTDVGTGLRLTLPGRSGSARVDIARGLRDGAIVFSAGWLAPWPGR